MPDSTFDTHEVFNQSPVFGGHNVYTGDPLLKRVASSAVSDAVSALTNLGYSAQQASAAVSKALPKAGEDADSAKLIRFGLKELAG